MDNKSSMNSPHTGDHVSPDDSLAAALDRLYKAGKEARGKPLYISAILLAHYAQGEGVRSVLQSFSLDSLPGDAILDIVVLIMPDEEHSLGSAGSAVEDVMTQFPDSERRHVHVLESPRPCNGVHCLFPYGRTVHQGIEDSLCRLHEAERRTGRIFNHVVVRASGDIRVMDREILAKLVHPLAGPEFKDVFVSTAVQESDWSKDELSRRLLVRPKMLAYARCSKRYIISSSAEAPGSMSAYTGSYFKELGISQRWGGGEDGVGFSLLDSRIKGVVVRDAVIYHCHEGRSFSEQLLSFGDWLYTGPINRLNRTSARMGIDQTRAFRYFMTHGILGDSSRSIILKAKRIKAVTPVIHLLRFAHMCRVCALMFGDIIRGRIAAVSRRGRQDSR